MGAAQAGVLPRSAAALYHQALCLQLTWAPSLGSIGSACKMCHYQLGMRSLHRWPVRGQLPAFKMAQPAGHAGCPH